LHGVCCRLVPALVPNLQRWKFEGPCNGALAFYALHVQVLRVGCRAQRAADNGNAFGMPAAFRRQPGDCMSEWMSTDFASLAWLGMSASVRSEDHHSAVPDRTPTLSPLSVIFDFFHRASSWSAARKFRNKLSAKTARLWGWVIRS
jgi:hypothetical protein